MARNWVLALGLLSALANSAEPSLPQPQARDGSPLERQEQMLDARVSLRLQNLGSAPGPTPGSRIYKLRDYESRSLCYVLSADRNLPTGISCVKE